MSYFLLEKNNMGKFHGLSGLNRYPKVVVKMCIDNCGRIARKRSKRCRICADDRAMELIRIRERVGVSRQAGVVNQTLHYESQSTSKGGRI